jgi:predicted O-methyltransferase YrrM
MSPRNLKKYLKVWTEVDRYFGDLLAPSDAQLDAALKANEKAGLPPIDVTGLQGKFLEVLIRISGAKRILEIGTLGGYSTTWMARALPPDGRIVSLEFKQLHADVARQNLRNAGVSDRVEIRVGPALESLPGVQSEGLGPFDFIFIDADKRSNPHYLDWALKLSRPGTVILVDNVVREGEVVDADSADPDIQGTRSCIGLMAANARLSTTALQTVGAKGYDGFALAVVLPLQE